MSALGGEHGVVDFWDEGAGFVRALCEAPTTLTERRPAVTGTAHGSAAFSSYDLVPKGRQNAGAISGVLPGVWPLAPDGSACCENRIDYPSDREDEKSHAQVTPAERHVLHVRERLRRDDGLCTIARRHQHREYVTWETCERKGEGCGTVAVGRQVDALEVRLKWVPFLIPRTSNSRRMDREKGRPLRDALPGSVDTEQGGVARNPNLPKWIDDSGEFAKRSAAPDHRVRAVGIQGVFGSHLSSRGGGTSIVAGEYHNLGGSGASTPLLASFRKVAARAIGKGHPEPRVGTSWRSLDEADFRGARTTGAFRREIGRACQSGALAGLRAW